MTKIKQLDSRRRAVSSLPPSKNRPPQQTKKCIRPSRPKTRHSTPTRGSVAVSQEESFLVSANGDVLVCRGREFAKIFGKEVGSLDNAALRWCEMECAFPMPLEESTLCNPWIPTAGINFQNYGAKLNITENTSYKYSLRSSHFGLEQQGLKGGGGTDIAGGVTTLADGRDNGHQNQPYFPNESDIPDIDDDRVLSLPSFDYSHFRNGGNDMFPSSPPSRSVKPSLPPIQDERDGMHNIIRDVTNSMKAKPKQPLQIQDRKETTAEDSLVLPPFMHGVPTFLPSLSQVRITQVSAHPLGSHVLLISAEALLFSYGLNDHGQLGIGVKTPVGDYKRRFIWTPTIITPLLENGGKAITCAAGESHSLVVVQTEGRRVLKSQLRRSSLRHLRDEDTDQQVTFDLNRVISSPTPLNAENEDGDNSSSSRSATPSETVLHHQLYGFGRNNFAKIGLVHPKRTKSDSGDEMDDVLLPRRVALHCTVWPERDELDESSPSCGIFSVAASSEHSAALVRRATGDIELYTWGNGAYGALGVTIPQNNPERDNSNPRKQKSMSSKTVPIPTLVQKLSYSTKYEQPFPSLLLKQKKEYPIGVSLAPYCSFVVTSEGRCLSFGISLDGMLGQGSGIRESFDPTEIKFSKGSERISVTSISAGSNHVVALTKTGIVYAWGSNNDARLGVETSSIDDDNIQWFPKRLDITSLSTKSEKIENYDSKSSILGVGDRHIVQACAGCDCTFLVCKSGKVLSCGKMSGRLGLGELSANAKTPRPLFGGLQLWHRCSENMNSIPTDKKRRDLKRGETLG